MIPSCCRIRRPEPGNKTVHYSCISINRSIYFLFTCAFLVLYSTSSFAQDLLDKKISLKKQKTSLYDALNLIAEKAECSFVYDSQVVENEKRIRLYANHQSVKSILDDILNNPDLVYRVIDNHILICLNASKKAVSSPIPLLLQVQDSARIMIIKGRVYDNANRKPLPYVSVGIPEHRLGSVTNQDGFFSLKIPVEYLGSSLVVSHIGYNTQTYPLRLVKDEQVDIFLVKRIISIQEVIIRFMDPLSIIEKAMKNVDANYSSKPSYLTTFYREGVNRNGQVVSYSEAVMKVYKSDYDKSEQFDQVKLLKSRRFQNPNRVDTVMLKLKAGVLAGLQLDIVKSIPSFLDINQLKDYSFTYSDLISYNDREAYAITFTQKPEVTDALFTGTLYVDYENFAILGADFEINAQYLDKAAESLIQKKSRKLIVKFEKIGYSVNYTNYNGRYYINHARSDLRLKTKYRNHLGYDYFNTYMEVATCHIDTLNVTRFPNHELIKPDVVFSETDLMTDESFWGDFNVIMPEAKLNDAMSLILGKLESIR